AVVADELALQRLPGQESDTDELHVRVLRRGGHTLDRRGTDTVAPTGPHGEVQVDAGRVVVPCVRRHGDAPGDRGDGAVHLIIGRHDLGRRGPVLAVGRAGDEVVAVRLDRGEAVVLAVAVVRPRDPQLAGHSVVGHLGEAVDPEVETGQRGPADVLV